MTTSNGISLTEYITPYKHHYTEVENSKMYNLQQTTTDMHATYAFISSYYLHTIQE